MNKLKMQNFDIEKFFQAGFPSVRKSFVNGNLASAIDFQTSPYTLGVQNS